MRIASRPIVSASPSPVQRAVAAKAAPAPATGWDRRSYLPPANAPRYTAAESRQLGSQRFAISAEASQQEARQVGEFFERYPSRGATQISFFHSYWALHQTFQKVPLQAYLYHATRPVDESGKPRGPLWQAYTRAIETGQPPAVVEAAFLRAHIQAFKDVTATPTFKQLYATATPAYRQVVEAYLDALTQFERDLDAGKDPVAVGRGVFTGTMRWLQKRGVTGFMATGKGMRAMLNPANSLARQMWGALGSIASSTLFNHDVDRPAPVSTRIQLTAGEAKALAAETGIPFKAGVQDLTPEMLAHASVAEPERREGAKGPAKRYALRMEDFTAPQHLRQGLRMAGPDGVMDAREVRGVIANVQGRVRSQLIEDFFKRYPVPQAGIQIYSANMLSMNGVYGQSEMANTLADAIMPVDNDGQPKGAYWKAYAEAYDRHKATGAPSQETLESLWFRAHMHDFEVVDTPAFQRQLEAFWRDAAADKAFEPLAVYTKAMVGGRQQFEKASREHVSEESAFAAGLSHFTRTILSAGSFPFWAQDLRAAKAAYEAKGAPALDDRGLPTDATLFKRSLEGLQQMTGLKRVALEGLKQRVLGKADRQPASEMIDLKQVLSPEQIKQLDPRVVAFYRHPEGFDIRAGIDLPAEGFGDLVLGMLGPKVSGLGDIPDRVDGFENFPLECELYRDAEGRTHWDRYVVVDGERRSLFLARFEAEGRQLKETFKVNGVEIALYFNLSVKDGGLVLALDPKRSSKLAGLSNIVFTTMPSATGLVTVGRYTCRQKAGLVKGAVEMRIAPKAA